MAWLFLWAFRWPAALLSSSQCPFAAFWKPKRPQPFCFTLIYLSLFKMSIHLSLGLQASASCFVTTMKLDKICGLRGYEVLMFGFL